MLYYVKFAETTSFFMKRIFFLFCCAAYLLNAASRPDAEAASILAKWYRDDYMMTLHEKYPIYNWKSNKGYPTKKHYDAIALNGITEYHRKSFALEKQLTINF